MQQACFGAEANDRRRLMLDEMEARATKNKFLGGTTEEMYSNLTHDNLFGRILGKASGKCGSDIRLKEDVVRVGTSASGIPEYDWHYIGDKSNTTFHGTVAQDLLAMGRGDAVSTRISDGMLVVDYSVLDVLFYALPLRAF